MMGFLRGLIMRFVGINIASGKLAIPTFTLEEYANALAFMNTLA
jgi:hypothetical protein